MDTIKFDAAQEAIQHYKNEGYNFEFTKASISKELPQDWEIEAVHTFVSRKDALRSQIVYALTTKNKEHKGIIVRRVGSLGLPFKALFLQQVELANEPKETPSV